MERNKMKNRWTILLSFVAGILITALVPILVLATSAINMGADDGHARLRPHALR